MKLLLALSGAALWLLAASPLPASGETTAGLRYVNAVFGFHIDLAEAWQGYSVLTLRWMSDDGKESGPLIKLRHPLWTAASPREDMPVMVFTRDQWARVQREDLRVSAAPYPPEALGENSKFVLALPPRYNLDYLTGFEEVDQLVHRLVAFEPSTR